MLAIYKKIDILKISIIGAFCLPSSNLNRSLKIIDNNFDYFVVFTVVVVRMGAPRMDLALFTAFVIQKLMTSEKFCLGRMWTVNNTFSSESEREVDSNEIT